jgi:signal transduction histidine kinase
LKKKLWKDKRDFLIGLGLDRTMNEGRFERTDKVLIDYATVPLPDGGVLMTYGDVTDSMRVENALREKNAALEAAEQLKLDFLANVSYQLRTPLNAIMGFNEMLDQQYFGPLNDKQREYTRDINEASTRLLSLINDILDLSTIEAGYMNLEMNDVSIKEMLESVTDLVRDWARKGGIEVELSCPANIGKAEMDVTRVKQVMINLLRNAISHTPKNGKIDITARKKKDIIQISVTDNGAGIAPEDQIRVLQPFERVEGGHQSAARGVGLGLTLVQNIVALHGGEFALESALGKGTTVTISIPVKQPGTNQNKAA